MKLSKNAVPLSKLQSLSPFAKSSGLKQGLRRLIRRPQSQSNDASSQADAAKPSKASGLSQIANNIEALRSSKGMKVFLHLLLVRPWVLVLGLWMLSLVGGSMALGGLLSPRQLMTNLPEPVVEVPEIHSDAPQVTVSDEPINAEGEASAAATTQAGTGLPVLPITLLVGGCATGCLIVSRRRAMARMTAARATARTRSRSKQGTHRVRPVAARPQRVATESAFRSEAPSEGKKAAAKSSNRTPATALSRGKKRRQRTRRAPAASASGMRSKGPVLASRTTAQPPEAVRGGQPRRASRRRTSARGTRRGQPVVSVVPANVAHSLDWPEGSLAHQMDVRHRSAM